MKYYLRVFGKLFGGIAIIVVSLFPLLLGAAFFLSGCDFQEWTAMFSDPEGIPMSEGLMIAIMAVVTLVFLVICMYGFWVMLSASLHNSKEYGEMILDAFVKYRQEEQAKCSHDTVHQVDFSNLLKCDECGATFENKHFVAE